MNSALELDSVLFLTLNYDTLLDGRLAEYWPLRDREWYVETDSRWALVKLHGSVNWGWPIAIDLAQEHPAVANSVAWSNDFIDRYEKPGELRFEPEQIELRLAGELGAWRYNGAEPTVYFPALAVPLGEEDELVCPPSHVRVAEEFLSQNDGLNLLVIGYSGADREVLRLFAESGNTLQRLLVANGSSDMAATAAQRIVEAFGQERFQFDITTEGFSELVASGTLRGFMTEIGKT